MQFHVFNMDNRGDSEVYLHGKLLDKLTAPIQTLCVTGVVSPVYFLPMQGHEQHLIAELWAFSTEIRDIEKVRRDNIFYKGFPRKLMLLKVILNKKVDFGPFQSEFCEMQFSEFQTPVENLVISKSILGPGIVEFKRVERGVIKYEDFSFVRQEKLPPLRTASVAVTTTWGGEFNFVFYCEGKSTTGSGTEESSIRGLREVIKKESPDFIVFHNFHLKSRLNLKDKIVCDIFSFAQGAVRCKDYSIQELCSIYRIEKGLGLEGDARALLGIAEAMSVLPLAKEMADISGYLLNRCLGSCRAERIEYTLMHSLYGGNFIFPPAIHHVTVPYTGGLVLEPVRGFYEDIVLLLDFNSLYPSIIQEFHVCYSTVGLGEEHVPGTDLFLPGILRTLVKRRRVVKDLLKRAKTPEERTTLDIRQKALKLTANSIYGCLGLPTSRFCNFDMAAYITAKGRDLLMETKRVAAELKMQVIYGDTDSIMIHTEYPGCNAFYAKATESAKALVAKINAKYSNIEIELEKAFKKLLLYTKKRYAALVFEENGTSIETKGIDLVRRDFCSASTDLSRLALNIMLEDREANPANGIATRDPKYMAHSTNTIETAEKIYKVCSDFYNTLHSRPVDDFVISSVLSKDPSQYASTEFPHVNLAKRLKETKNIVYLQDDVVSYVIGDGTGPISGRAFHPEERFGVDYTYYIDRQILPPLYRLVSLLTHIQVEKIRLIFGAKEVAPKEIQHALTFTLPCCQNIQRPDAACFKCGAPVPTQFYVHHISTLLHKAASALYQCLGKCTECNIEYRNHLTRCFVCQKDLVFDFKNFEFNRCLASIETSFGHLQDEQISKLIKMYSDRSAYRIIDMTRYFSKELAHAEELWE